jgi:hypothetical protein
MPAAIERRLILMILITCRQANGYEIEPLTAALFTNPANIQHSTFNAEHPNPDRPLAHFEVGR